MIFEIKFIKDSSQDLLSTLYAMSQPASTQMSLIGPPHPGEEMLVDFFSEYTNLKENYTHYNFFSNDQFCSLNKIEEQLKKVRARTDAENALLNPELLETDKDWALLRTLAKDSIEVLGLDLNQITPEVEIKLFSDAAVYRYKVIIEKD